MFCSNCGNQLPEGARFCSVCGAKVVDIKTPIENHTEKSLYQDYSEPNKESHEKVSFDWSGVVDESRKKTAPAVKSPWDTTGVDDENPMRTAGMTQNEERQSTAPRYTDNLVEELSKPSEDRHRTMSFIDILKQERDDKERIAAEEALPLTESVKLESDYSAFQMNAPEAPAAFVEPAEAEEETLNARDNSDLESELASILGKGNAFSFADEGPEILSEDRTVELPENLGMDNPEQENADSLSEGEDDIIEYDPIEDDYDDVSSRYENDSDAVEEPIKPALTLDDVEEVAPFTPIGELKPGAVTANIDASESEIESLKRRLAELMGNIDDEPEETQDDRPVEDIYGSLTDEVLQTTQQEATPQEPSQYDKNTILEEAPIFETAVASEEVYYDAEIPNGTSADINAQETAIEDVYLDDSENSDENYTLESEAKAPVFATTPVVEDIEPVDEVEEVDIASLLEELEKQYAPASKPAKEEPDVREAFDESAGDLSAPADDSSSIVASIEEPADGGIDEIDETIDIDNIISELAETYSTEPAVETVEEPVTETAEEPAVETVEEPAFETAEEPAFETVEEPVTETAEEPAVETPVEPVIETAATPVIEKTENAEDVTYETVEDLLATLEEIEPEETENELEVPAEKVEAEEVQPEVETIASEEDMAALAAAGVIAAVQEAPAPAEESVTEESVMTAAEVEPVAEESVMTAEEVEPVAEAVASENVGTESIEPENIEITDNAVNEEIVVSSVETDAMSIEELEKDLFGDAFDADEEATKKIDKFFTLYKKNEEFQKLLDEEYSKIQGDANYEIGTSKEAESFAAQQQPVVQMSAPEDTELKQSAPQVVQRNPEKQMRPESIKQPESEKTSEIKPVRKAPVEETPAQDKPTKAQRKAEKKAAKAAAKAAKSEEFYDDDEEGGNVLTIVAVVIAVILVLLLAAILIINFAPSSAIGMKLDSIVENITSYFTVNDMPDDTFLL